MPRSKLCSAPAPVAFRLAAAAVLFLSAGRSADAGVAFQGREDIRIRSAPVAAEPLVPEGTTLVVATDDGLIALTHANGTLALQHRVAALRFPKSIAVGDFDGDGRPEIACADGSSAAVSVVAWQAENRFGKPVRVPMTDKPLVLRSVPLARGGRVGLLVAGDEGISLLLADRQKQLVPTDVLRLARAADLDAADVDGDGRTDVLVAEGGDGPIVLLRGDGRGGFMPVHRVPTVRNAQRVTAADLTGDGRVDLVVLSATELVVHAQLSADESRDATTDSPQFAPSSPIARGLRFEGLAVHDLDGDRIPDLVVTDSSHDTVTILRGAGDGTFRQTQCLTTGRGPSAVRVFDLPGDSRPAVLVLNRLGDSLTLMKQDGAGRYRGIETLTSDASDFGVAAVADFNLDSRPDIAVVSEQGGTVSVFLSQGNGQFAHAAPLRVGRQPRAMTAADLNADGFPDLAIADFASDSLRLLYGDGQGGFAAPETIRVGAGPTAVIAETVGGRASLVVANLLADSVSVLYGKAGGGFADPVDFRVVARPNFLMVGDMHQDGIADVVVGSERGDTVAVLRRRGATFDPPTTQRLRDVARPLVAEDFDGDGNLDLVEANWASDAIDVILSLPGGGFGPRFTFPVGRHPDRVEIGDFDGDGKPDLAVVRGPCGAVSILLNTSARPESADAPAQRR